MTSIIYLIGRPGTGKYSIAKEIAKSGYTICDNQLINNPIFALLNYDGLTPVPEYAWNTIEQIRESVFNFLSIITDGNYVLTNVLYDDDCGRKCFDQVKQMASKRGSLFVPVKLLISKEENIKRIQNPERLARYKSINIADAVSEASLINISNAFELDVTELSAIEAADEILHLGQ